MATYDAFISYSHANDKAVAAALQAAVQRLGKPWYRRRALRIFRDDTSLSATPHLWPAIENALDRSRYPDPDRFARSGRPRNGSRRRWSTGSSTRASIRC